MYDINATYVDDRCTCVRDASVVHREILCILPPLILAEDRDSGPFRHRRDHEIERIHVCESMSSRQDSLTSSLGLNCDSSVKP